MREDELNAWIDRIETRLCTLREDLRAAGATITGTVEIRVGDWQHEIKIERLDCVPVYHDEGPGDEDPDYWEAPDFPDTDLYIG